jgi:hypothetical protein
MGIMEWFFYRDVQRPKIPPILDFNIPGGTLGPLGIKTHQREIMRLLGPPVSWWAVRGEGLYIYPEAGLNVEAEQEEVTGFTVAMREPQFCDFKNFTGKQGNGQEAGVWRPFAGRIKISPDFDWLKADGITTRHFMEQAGEPKQIDNEPEDNEIVYEYRGGAIDYDAEFLTSGELKCIRVWPNYGE